MIKLSKDELSRCHQILMDVWNAIAPDIDTIEGGIDNLGVIALCADYIDMYSRNKKADLEFMRVLWERHGFEQVCEALDKEYQYY